MHQPWVTPLPVSCNGQSQIVTVLGSQWGDEGKGKLVDVLAAESDVCCRFNGELVGLNFLFHCRPPNGDFRWIECWTYTCC